MPREFRIYWPEPISLLLALSLNIRARAIRARGRLSNSRRRVNAANDEGAINRAGRLKGFKARSPARARIDFERGVGHRRT